MGLAKRESQSGSTDATNDRVEFRRHGGAILGVRVVGALLQVLFSIAVARVAGPAGSGIFFLALTGVTIASVIGRVGLDYAVVRFVAGSAAAGRWGEVRGVYGTAMRIAIPATTGLSILVCVGAGWLATAVFRDPAVGRPLLIMSFAIVPLAIGTLHAELLRGMRRTVVSQLVQVILIPSVALVLIAVVPGIATVEDLVMLYVAGASTALVVGWGLWRVELSRLPSATAAFPRATLLRASTPLLGMAVMEFVLVWSGIIALGLWREAEDVGVFAIASRIAGIPTYLLLAANVWLGPKLAELHGTNQRERLGQVARETAGTMAVLALPLVALLILAPRLALGVFGSGFEVGALSLQIMVIGQYVNIAAGSVGYLLVMTGHERSMRNVVAVSMVVNVLLNIALVPRMGVTGAAIAHATSAVIQNVLALALVYRHLGIVAIAGKISRRST